MNEFFKHMFRNKSQDKQNEYSSNLPINIHGVKKLSIPETKTTYKVASCQSSGRARSHNEDTLFTLNSLLDGFDPPISFGLYIIADGMGGHQSGEIASRLAVQASSLYLIENVYNGYIFDRKFYSDVVVTSYLDEAVQSAQKQISHQVPGGGTTLTLIMILGERLFFTHVGDSRLYKIDLKGKMSLITKDHSLVKRLIDLGEITEEEASIHPQRNVLYRALGQTDPFKPDIGQLSLASGERFLICSDGLWGVLDEKQMMGIISMNSEIEQIACDLVNAANESGGPDNISLILVERLL